MKKIFKNTILAIFIFVIIFYISIIFIFPDKLVAIQGRENEYKYHLPLQMHVDSQFKDVLSIEDKSISDNIHLDLYKGLTLIPKKSGVVSCKLKIFGMIPIKNVSIDVIDDKKLVPCGITTGIKVKTEGVMILGTGYVNSIDGNKYEPCKGIIKSGDLILKVNDKKIDCKTDLIKEINKEEIKLYIKRKEEFFTCNIKPIQTKEKEYKLGLWIRDITQGIGTITYYDKETLHFGALGHGISDVDTREIIPIECGEIVKSEILSIKKGQKGLPGELSGIIIENKESILGKIYINSSCGIFGNINENCINDFPDKEYHIGLKNEIKEGEAYILSDVCGNGIEKYSINIERVAKYNNLYNNTKGLLISINDKRLLEKTNGIIQGMSGSPIIQGNKIIGAVTHVFVQDPSRGYGIFIENMLDSY